MREPTGKPVEIRDGITAWVNGGCGWGASNAALITGHGNSLLVDTMWDLPRTAEMLQGFAPRLASAPISQLVNTHADGDHWFGNSLVNAGRSVATRSAAQSMAKHGPAEMRALGAAAQAFKTIGALPFGACRNWRVAGRYFGAMVRPYDFRLSKPPLPNTTFSGKFHVEMGGRAVHLVELGPAHTAGDLAVLLPDDRVALTGDLVFSGVLPVLWDGSMRRWIAACDFLLSQRIDTIVPGHGPLGDLSAVEAMRSYWQFLGDAAHHQFNKGRQPIRAARRILASDAYQQQPFARWSGQERTVINVHAVYRKLLRRRRRIGTWSRLMVLKQAALLEEEIRLGGGIEKLSRT